MAANNKSEIQEFFRGKKVLITGATGFLGKVMVEKLLRSTETSMIYMLVRPKKGKSVLQRTNEYFDDVLFSRLKEEVVDYKARVMTIEGDVSLIGLGLSNEDTSLLQSELDVIFHGAATVRFDEALDTAVAINVRGTKEMLMLARKCSKLKAFIHLSTAYANCKNSFIKEELFEPPISGDNTIKLTECLSSKQIQDVSNKIIDGYPNTYSFTKGIAENIVQVYGKGMPVVVFRPAIVVATAEEPIKGWIDNVYGPTGVQVGVGAGVLRVFLVNVEYVAELVPVDMVVNAAICAAWDISRHWKDDTIPVYNFVSSCQKPLIWSQFLIWSLRYGRQTPTIHAMWYYTITVSKYRSIYMVYQFLLHILPALAIDSILYLTGNNPSMMSIYKKIHKFSSVIAYFSTRKWTFDNTKVLQLWARMSVRDRELFNFAFTTLDWENFFQNTIAGLRQTFFKDLPETIPAARRKQFWFKLLHYGLMLLGLSGIMWLLLRITF